MGLKWVVKNKAGLYWKEGRWQTEPVEYELEDALYFREMLQCAVWPVFNDATRDEIGRPVQQSKLKTIWTVSLRAVIEYRPDEDDPDDDTEIYRRSFPIVSTHFEEYDMALNDIYRFIQTKALAGENWTQINDRHWEDKKGMMSIRIDRSDLVLR